MQLPVIGKVRRSSPWILGLVTAGILGVGGVTYVAVREFTDRPDLSTLTVPVEAQDVTARITASGTVQPIQTVNLSPKDSGILAELYVEQGDRVSAGEVIARMESDSIGAELAQARARVAQAEARLTRLRAGDRPQETAQRRASVEQARARVNEAQARLARANERLDRNQYLQDEGAISLDDLDAIRNEVAVAQATLEQSRASLREAEQQLALSREGSRVEDIAEAEAQLQEAIGNLQAVEVRQEDTVIRAPFSGIITQKYATEGAFVTPTTSASEATSATSTAIVALAEGLEILAEVPEVDVQFLEVGQPVEIIADAYPDQVFRGEVRLIAPEAVVQQNVTSFQVRIALLSGEEQLLSGMNVDLRFLGEELQGATVVPTVAIVTKDGETGVLVPDGSGDPEFRSVTLGLALGDRTQILEGLSPGEQVFIDIPPGSEWDPARQNEE